MKRRALLKAVGSSLLLTGAGFAPRVLASDVKSDPVSPLVHVFGTLPDPSRVRRVFAAGAPAAVALNSVAPQQLIGWPAAMAPHTMPWLSPHSRSLPVVGRLAGRGSTISTEQLMVYEPDLIVDLGNVNEHHLSMAKQFSEQMQIPYIVVSGRLADSPEQMRSLGSLLGQNQHGQLLAQAAQEILDEVEDKRQRFHGSLPSVYFARSASGLETGVGSSIHTEVIDLVGARSVSAQMEGERLGQVSMEQLLLWNPDVIITQDLGFYQQVYQHSLWKMVPAVQQKQVFLVPNVPFGWMDIPPGVNRLLGALWLSSWLYDEDQVALIKKLQRFFALYFAHEPSAAQFSELLNHPERFAA